MRAPLTFLFRFKKFLVKWGYTSNTVYVDEDVSSLKICGTLVLKASAKDCALNLNWVRNDFSTWADLQNNPEFIEIKKMCNDSLKAAHGRP